jgi:hypothetical protein
MAMSLALNGASAAGFTLAPALVWLSDRHGIAWAGTGHHRTKAANAQHSGRGRTDNTEPTTRARGCGSPLLSRRTDRVPGQAGVQRGDRVRFRDQTRRRRRAQLVAPPTEEGRQFGVGGILRCGRTS